MGEEDTERKRRGKENQLGRGGLGHERHLMVPQEHSVKETLKCFTSPVERGEEEEEGETGGGVRVGESWGGSYWALKIILHPGMASKLSLRWEY